MIFSLVIIKETLQRLLSFLLSHLPNGGNGKYWIYIWERDSLRFSLIFSCPDMYSLPQTLVLPRCILIEMVTFLGNNLACGIGVGWLTFVDTQWTFVNISTVFPPLPVIPCSGSQEPNQMCFSSSIHSLCYYSVCLLFVLISGSCWKVKAIGLYLHLVGKS